MDFLDNHNNTTVKLFIEFLSNRNNPPEYNWPAIEKKFGSTIYPDLLHLLTQTRFMTDEAKDHWFKIISHRRKLNSILGREVGFQVAACDYFTNIHPKLKNPVFCDLYRFMQKEKSALVDELTGLYNRRFFRHTIEKEMENAKRSSQPFSVLMLDVDFFKNYNDLFGHQGGDRVLTEISAILTSTARAIDYIVRYGGEEFIVILPRTDKKAARAAAERHRRAVESHYFSGQEKLPGGNLTVTIGVATYPLDAGDSLDLINKADVAMYKGKSSGKNQVLAFSGEFRRHPRYPFFREILFRLLETGTNAMHPAVALDISLGGLKIETRQRVDVKKQLEVLLNNGDNEKTLLLTADPVYLKQVPEKGGRYFLGLSFYLKNVNEKDILNKLINDVRGGMQ